MKKGDPIVELSDNDPDILARLRQEQDAVAARLDAAKARARSMESRIDSLADSRVSAVAAAESRIGWRPSRSSPREQALELAKATLTTAA
ncbi:MAG: hypothetical protein U0169_08535 [Polyangiaceae bacterium]